MDSAETREGRCVGPDGVSGLGYAGGWEHAGGEGKGGALSVNVVGKAILLTSHAAFCLFRRYLASLPEARWNCLAVPRYRFCLMVDDACLSSVLNGPQPGSKHGDVDGKGYVYIIDSLWQPEADDEGYRDVEGCTQEDVGWMKLRLASVAPRAYNMLENLGWDTTYVRPPRVAIP
ncbi:MAG: hypothetical protein Q9160_003419 [Pyrenula sp. 1 TL-2023]